MQAECQRNWGILMRAVGAEDEAFSQCVHQEAGSRDRTVSGGLLVQFQGDPDWLFLKIKNRPDCVSDGR